MSASETIYALEDLLTELREEYAYQSDPNVKAGLSMAMETVRDRIETQRIWERVNAMSREEIRAELNAAGITDERLDEGLAKCRAAVEAAIAERAATEEKAQGS